MAGALTAAIAAAFSGGSSPPVTTDEYFEYTTLLLPGNGTNGAQNNTFLDGSTNNFTITRNGNTTQGTFSPFSQTGWGNYFDGSGDSLTIPSGSSISGTGNFTVEFWIYPTTFASGYQVPYINETSGGFAVLLNSTGTLSYGRALVAVDGTTTGTVTFNQWNHVAFVRSGTGSNQFICYINGSSAGSFTNSTNYSSGIVRLGTDAGGTSFPFLGYLSNVRNVTIAVYTGAFTPPTSPLAATQSAGTNISAITGTQTSLLTCQSNRFVDNSASPLTITRNGDTRVVAFSPFNPTASWSAATYGGSGYFDGSGDMLATPSITIGASAFCFECWLYPTVTQGNTTGIFVGNTTNSLQVSYFGTAGLGIAQKGVAWQVNNSDNVIPTVNQWNHVAFVRSGTGANQTSIYLNGTRIANGTVSYSYAASTYEISTTLAGGTVFQGYISNARLTVGSSPYDATSSTLTVPTAPLTAITNTSLLLNFTNAGIYDATSKNDLETVGNAQVSTTQSKWGGSSMAFDGTGDSLVGINSPLRNFGTGDFTIEFWVYHSTLKNYSGLIGDRASPITTINIYTYADGKIGVTVLGSGEQFASASGIALATTWQHIALTRSSGTVNLYVDGTNRGTYSSSANMQVGNGAGLSIGSTFGTGDLNGYMQDVRVTSGYARYTGSTVGTNYFTPPTAAFPTL